MMRAKLAVQSVTLFSHGEEIKFIPVCPDKFGPKGESEDNTFARFTPSGSVSLLITNPDLYGKFRPGQKFYADFTPAE